MVVSALNVANSINNKGSLNNRFNCAKEHIKNDLKYELPVAAVTTAATAAAIIKPKPLVNAVKVLGEGIGQVGKFLANKVFKGGFGTGILDKVLKNPTKAGVIGLGIAGLAWLMNLQAKHSYNAGKIDQKYTDAAILESQSKNIVLDTEV